MNALRYAHCCGWSASGVIWDWGVLLTIKGANDGDDSRRPDRPLRSRSNRSDLRKAEKWLGGKLRLRGM